MSRRRLPIPFGQGLDLATGAMVGDVGTFHDLRNLDLRDSKAVARGGLTAPETGSPLPDVEDIVGVFPFRAINGGVLVGYNRTSRELTVWRTDGTGGGAQLMGSWATLISGSPLPIICGCESYGKFFLSHAEPQFNYRTHTIYFDPLLDPGAQIVTLVGNLDGNGDAPIKFREVIAYLSSVWGTGYGTATEENRPEIVRVSEAGNPTNWPKNAYFVAGPRDEAVTLLQPVGRLLQVCKEAQTFQIPGTNSAEWKILPMEQYFGAVGPKLGVVIGGVAYRWSLQGPRLSTGGLSLDIAVPLELEAPRPSDLAAMGALEYGWCQYEPVQRKVVWGFPVPDPAGDKTLLYELSIRTPGILKWAYSEVDGCYYSAGTMVQGGAVIGTLMTAYATNVVAADDGVSGTGRQVEITWDNNALIGGETVQIFKRESPGGPWSIAHSVACNGLGSQTATVTGFQAFQLHDIAIRYVKSGVATPGFTSLDPDLWDADEAPGAKTTVLTSCEIPVLTGAVWSRTSATVTQFLFSWTQAELGVGFVLQDSPDGSTGWADIETYPATGNPRTGVHEIDNAYLQTRRFYRLKAFRGAEETGWSNVLERYVGPTAIPDFFLFQAGTDEDFEVWLRQQPAGYKLAVETSDDGATWVRQFFSSTVGQPQAVTSSVAVDNTTATHVRAQYAVHAFGVDDFGEYSSVQQILLTDEAPPAAPAAFTGYTVNALDDIDVDFADPSPNSRAVIYFNSAVSWSPTYQVAGPAETTLNFTDVFTTNPGTWAGYTINDGNQPPAWQPSSVALVTTGGRLKRSDFTVEAVPVTQPDPPSNLQLSQPGGSGTLLVEWDNGVVGDLAWTTQVWWGPNPSGGTAPMVQFQFPVTVDGANDSAAGPQIGYPALPIGSTILVRVWHQKVVGVDIIRTAWVEDLVAIT